MKKSAILALAFFTFGGCAAAPKTQNFLDKIVGKTSILINEEDDTDPSKKFSPQKYIISEDGKTFTREANSAYYLVFVKEMGNYVAMYEYFQNGVGGTIRYFTAVKDKIYISDALEDSTPEGAPNSKDFLDKVKDIGKITVGKYKYTVSSDGKTFTEDLYPDYRYNWVTSAGDYAAVYEYQYKENTEWATEFTKIFSWRNGYFTSETVDVSQ